MLKPLKPKPTSKDVSKEVETEKPSEVIVSLVDGRTIYSNADTGEIITMDHVRHTPNYEVFNNEKASIVISSLAQGHKLIDSLEYASISKATFATWVMNNDEFSQAVEKARATRAQFTHEKFYALAHEELTGEIPEDDEELKTHLKKLSVIDRRQNILSKMKKEDNPNRFGDKEQNQLMAASVAISIDPDIISKMQTRFKSNLDKDGQLDTHNSHEQLQDILDVDYEEVTGE